MKALLALIIGIVIGVMLGKHSFWDIDRCHDTGGAWHYEMERCEYDR